LREQQEQPFRSILWVKAQRKNDIEIISAEARIPTEYG
jgi:hypothetical protein